MKRLLVIIKLHIMFSNIIYCQLSLEILSRKVILKSYATEKNVLTLYSRKIG